LSNVKSQLTELNLSGCENLPATYLSFFSDFVNLEKLDILGCNFYGFLKSLNGCQRLKEFNVGSRQSSTKIQADIESLPLSLTEFGFSGNQKIAAKIYPYPDLDS
jgi:hypothetical protein